MTNLYTGLLLEAAANIPPARRLAAPDATATRVSRVCGSELILDLEFKDGVISDFGLDARACALGQAAASLTAKALIGATPSELLRLRDQMRAMLKENGSPPDGERWADLTALMAIRDYPERHTSTLLIFEAIAECVNAYLAKAEPAPANGKREAVAST